MDTKRFFIGKAIGSIIVLVVALGVFWLMKSEPVKAPEDGWKSVTNSQGITFWYPEQLTTTYIAIVDWPPQIAVTEGPFTCTEAGEESARAGKTEQRMIGSRAYCVTKVTGAAAGSMYIQYSYITAIGRSKLVNLTFSLRFPQCANYDDPQKAQCQGERETFDIDSIIDRIVRTI